MTIKDDLQQYLIKHPILKNPRMTLILVVVQAILGIVSFLYPQPYSLYLFFLSIVVLLLVYLEKPSFKKEG